MSRDFNLLDRYLDYLYLSYLHEIMMTSFRELGNYTKCIVDASRHLTTHHNTYQNKVTQYVQV